MRTLILPGLGIHCAVSDHALKRYGERVRPHLAGDRDALRADMRRLVDVCGLTSPLAPSWVRNDWIKEAVDSDLWVHCGDVALAVSASEGLCPYVVTTVMAKGSISDVARSKRNLYRSGRTYRKRKAKHNDRKAPRRMPPRHVNLPDPT